MKVSTFSAIIVLACASPVCAAQAKSAGVLAVPPIAAPIADGRLTRTEWQSACQITGWADNVLGVANNDGTTASAGHAGGTLYLLFRCPIPEKFRLNKVMYASFPLKMTIKEKDGDILQDDYVGISLTPPGSRNIYFLGVNGAGITRDSRNGDVAWNGQWHVQQTQDDYFWTVELSVPLAQFGKSTAEGSNWGVNFEHGARHLELLQSVWAYQAAELHPMAQMQLSSRPIAVAVTGFGNLSDGIVAMKGQVANLSTEAFSGVAEVTVLASGTGKHPAFGPEKIALSLKPGEKKDLAASFELGQPICGEAVCRITDGQGLALLNHPLPFVFAREMGLETRFIPTPAILQLVLDLGTSNNVKKVTEGQVKVIALDTKRESLSQALPALHNPLSIVDVDCSQLSPGRYEASVELKAGATPTVLKSVFVKDPKPEWLGNTIGITDKVPAPWTPLKANGRTVECWGRQYTFGAAGFPSQINILGQDVLAAPVRIVVRHKDRIQNLPLGVCRATEKKDTRATFASISKVGRWTIAADTWIEFDGFVWNMIKVKTDVPTEIDGLSVEIPLKKEYATLWWHPDISYVMLTSQIGAPPKQPLASAPMNFLRLGDEEHGIQFCYESLRNWNPVPGKGQELIPGDKEYVLRYNLIGQTTKVDNPLEFSLGYMALPCRPRSELFRRINASNQWGGGQWGGGWGGGMWGAGPTWPDKARMDKNNWLFQTYAYGAKWQGRVDCSYFNIWNEEVFDEDTPQKCKQYIVPMWETNRSTMTLYYQATGNDANTPEYRKYRYEWKKSPGNAPYVPPDPKTRQTPVGGSVCQQSASYCDFQVWYMDKVIRYLSDNGKIPIHGYQDCGAHPSCANTLHGCPADGGFPVLANREWAKRIYIMYKTINPLNQLYIHTGGESAMNWGGFFDVMTEGEQFTARYLADRVNDPSLPKDYTKIIDLDRFRAQFQPYAWGPDRFFLTQFHEWMTNEPDEARGCMGHLWGLAMCHDTPVSAAWPPASVTRSITELGWDDKVEFIPYWRKKAGIDLQSPISPVVASAWRRGPAALLVIVMNDSHQIAKSDMKIDLPHFGFKAGAVNCRDYGCAGLAYPNALFTCQSQKSIDPQLLPVQDTVVQAGTVVPMEIGPHSFRMLRFWQ